MTDYDSNLQYVKHVLTMDTTFPDNRGMWRRIELQSLHHVAYLTIILIEAAVALLLWIGVARLWRSRGNALDFNHAKAAAVLGLGGAVALFFGGFLALGGEWFLMLAIGNVEFPAGISDVRNSLLPDPTTRRAA